MDKEDVVHIYNGILLGHRKEQKNAICGYMDEPIQYSRLENLHGQSSLAGYSP